MNQYRVNNQIRANKVRLIDEHGENAGEITIQEALQRAKDAGKDLIEINPNGSVPVCKILDYGKFQYREAKNKKKNEAHSKKQKMKTIRLSVRTGAHDIEMKSKKAVKFLTNGDVVRVDLRLRGREKAHRGFAKEKMEEFLSLIKPYIADKYQLKFVPSGFTIDLRLDQEKYAKLKASSKENLEKDQK